LAYTQGDYGRTAALQAEALALYRELSDARGIADSLHNLGNVAIEQCDYSGATALYEEALALRRELGDTRGSAASLNNLGNVAHEQGDYGRAGDLHAEALTLCRTTGDRRLSVYCLEGLAAVAGAHGQPKRAARLFGAAETMRRLINAPCPPNEQPHYERLVAVARAQLDEEEFAAAWAAGQAVPLEQAIAEALSSQEAIALAREEYAHEG
jgi:tetratricopeptide (TPR) repeat protein